MRHIVVQINPENTKVVDWYIQNKDALPDAARTLTGFEHEDVTVKGELCEPKLCVNLADIEFIVHLEETRYRDAAGVCKELSGLIKSRGIESVATKWVVSARPNRDVAHLVHRVTAQVKVHS